MHAGPGSLEEPRIDELTRGLRRLARGLVQGDADADDLVQDAWVAALRSPPDDPARLGGWLRRTLRNLAIDRRDAAARRRGHENAVAQPAESSDPDPGRIETLRALLAEVEALDQPFRETIELRFLEGQPPRQIATRLGVPVATVHSRIQRGLARLRVRLDARHGGDRRAWLVGLGPWVQPANATFGMGGVLLMKVVVMVLVAMTVLGGGGAAAWWLWGDGARRDQGRGAVAGDSESNARVAGVPEPGSHSGEGELLVREALVPSPVDDAVATVRGRCIDDVTGAPLAGVTAHFRGYDLEDHIVELHASAPDWIDPQPVVTDRDGRFELAYRPHPAKELTMDLVFDGYAPRRGAWMPTEPGAVEDLGDVRMQRGFVVEGHVVDEQGGPVEGAVVLLHDLPLPIRSDMHASSSGSGWSGPDGRFEVREPIPAGTWPIRVDRTGHLVGPKSMTVPLVEPFVVHIASLKEVRGLVLDERGEPMGRLQLEAHTADGQRLRTGWVEPDGTFVISESEPGDGPPASIRFHDFRRGHRIVPATFAVQADWGDRNLVVRVERSGELPLRVVAAESGEAVEKFAVRLFPVEHRRDGEGLRAGGHHPGGALTLEGLVPGENVLLVVPTERHWAAPGPRTIVFDGNPVPTTLVELQRRVPVSVTVSDTDGARIAGATLELIHSGAGRRPFTVDRDVPWWPSLPEPYAERSFPTHIDRGIADADGRGELFHDPACATPVFVRASAEGFLPSMQKVTVRPDLGIELVLRPAAAIVGRLSVGTSGALLDGLEARLVPAGSTDMRLVRAAHVQSDGAFQFAGLSGGPFDLRIGIRRIAWRSALARDLECDEGETLDVGSIPFDASPARVVGRVRIGDQTPEDALLWLRATDESPWDGLLGTFPIDADGRVEIADLPGGRWHVYVMNRFGDRDRASWSRGETVLDVAPGEQAQVEIVVPHRVLRIRALDPAGVPLPGAVVSISEVDERVGSRTIVPRADANGEVVLDPAPDLALRLRLRAGELSSEPMQIEPPGRFDEVGEVEVVLRASSK